MKLATTMGAVSLCALLAGCVPPQQAPQGVMSDSAAAYRTDLAQARGGSAPAAFRIAERFATPDKYPDSAGVPPNMYDAAVWCDMIKLVKPTAPEVAQCATLITGLSPADVRSAQVTAQGKVQGGNGMARGNGG